MEKRKVILFGVDGATWRAITPLVSDGVLKNFGEILRDGAHGILESTIPPITLPAWTSMFTGVNPGKHGITDYILRINGEFRLYTQAMREVNTIWHILSDSGEKIILLNDPISYPPEPIGIHITGFLTPSSAKNYTHPPEVFKELDKVSGGYIPEIEETYYKILRRNFDSAYRILEEYAQKLFKAAHYLLSNYEWDVAAIIFTSTDRLQHFYWKKPKYIRNHYIQIDSYLGKVMEISSGEEAEIIIASDHGFRGVKKQIYINSLLLDLGYLKSFKETAVTESLRRIGINRKVLLRIFSKTPPILRILRKIAPQFIKRCVPTTVGRRIDYENSVTFAYTDTGLFINKSLHKGENSYRSIKKEIMERILSVKGDDGCPFLSAVYEKEEVIWGPYVERAPDLFMIAGEGVKIRPELIPGKIWETIEESPEALKRTGDHDLEGVLMLFGPDVKRGVKLSKHKIWDVAPTILALRDAPIPDYFDGKTVSEGFKELKIRFVSHQPAAFRKRLTRIAQKVRKKLEQSS